MKKVKTAGVENFAEWDDYMEWKACIHQLKDIEQNIAELKSGSRRGRMKTDNDPVVEEVQKTRKEFFKECGFDMDILFKRLEESSQARKEKALGKRGAKNRRHLTVGLAGALRRGAKVR